MKKKNFFYLMILLMLFSVLFSQERGVQALRKERRIALIIGNARYKSSPLRNPVNDATDMAGVLRKKGFDVTLKTNADRRAIINAIKEFGEELERGGVGLFYFSGHGIQVEGQNYLIPIGSNIQAEHEISLESVNVNRILGFMENAKNRLNILILDACRDNPFVRSFRSSTRGLAQMDSPLGTLIAYSTSPGDTAADGSGRNGIYTKHLLDQIETSNLEVGQMFRVVRSNVRVETNGKQIPWESTSLEGGFYFTTGTDSQQTVPVLELEILKAQLQPDIIPSSSGVLLRSSYETLSNDEVESMIKRLGFFEVSLNKYKTFKNQYEKKILNGCPVVVDNATGLMWYLNRSSKYITYMTSNEATQWIEKLNQQGYAGFNDWRLPTLEEGASLLESSKKKDKMHIASIFIQNQRSIWTGDKYDSSWVWLIDFKDGRVDSGTRESYNCVRLVRTIKQNIYPDSLNWIH